MKTAVERMVLLCVAREVICVAPVRHVTLSAMVAQGSAPDHVGMIQTTQRTRAIS